MKKIIMLLAIAALGAKTMAQETNSAEVNKHEVLTTKFGDNWFVSAGIGAEMLFGNNDAHVGIGDRISPTFNVGLGKWITPDVGVRLQYSGYEAKGSRKRFGSFAKGQPDAAGYYDQKFHYMNLHGDVMFNLSSMIGGYNANRVYEVIPYLGAGFSHSYSGVKKRDGFSVNAGIINKFRVSPAFDVNLELGGMMAQNKFDAEIGGKCDFDGVVSATVGVTYRFKNRGFKNTKKCPQLISEAELRDLRNRANASDAENQSLRDQLARKSDVVTETVVKTVGDIAPRAVFFEIGSSKVVRKEEVNIGHLANYMKKYPEIKVQLFGYADKATGSAEYNKELSIKRAQAVASILFDKYGISKDRIALEGEGGVELFQEVYLNRMVLIETVK